MTDFLFKGKRSFNGEWVEGSLVIVNGYYAIIERDQEKLDPRDRMDIDKDCCYFKGYATKVIPESVICQIKSK